MAAENRTERPTSRRLQKAREKGQVARSREVPGALVLFSGLLVVSYTAHQLMGVLTAQMSDLLRMRVPHERTV
jgi:flagellar biosynthesis protein FlhB